jgi:hypothetical protein
MGRVEFSDPFVVDLGLRRVPVWCGNRGSAKRTETTIVESIQLSVGFNDPNRIDIRGIDTPRPQPFGEIVDRPVFRIPKLVLDTALTEPDRPSIEPTRARYRGRDNTGRSPRQPEAIAWR